MLSYICLEMIKYLDSKKIQSLKKVKLWANVHAPSQIKPIVNYALGWVCPELLGHGVEIKQHSDHKITAQIPYADLNKDAFAEIQQGLVFNVGSEMVYQFLLQYLDGVPFEIEHKKSLMQKNLIWNSNLNMEMADQISEVERQMNLFISDAAHAIPFTIYIKTENSKTTDTIQFDLKLKKKFLLD